MDWELGMLKTISIDELTPGMMINQVIEQNGPVKIRKVGLVRSKDMITGLAEMGVIRVEVDLEQSVEIEPTEVPTSMTQKLLQGEYDHASQVDKSLSEQFNRSLFLPSVSELPSMWQIYLRQAGVAIAVIIIGMSLGFSGAWIPQWLSGSDGSLVTASDSLSEVAASPPVVEPPAELTSQKTSETNDTQDKVLLTTSDSVDEPKPEVENQAKKLTQGSGQDNTDLAESQQQDTGSNELEEGALLTQTPDEASLGGVSADLLARFNRALEDIENDTGQQETETTVSVVSDLPRVDQLRALTLTRLPSMTFSAHMYSSNRDTRWVRVNGRQLFEGEWIEDGLQLVNIEPQRVVLSFQGELFTMAALTDW